MDFWIEHGFIIGIFICILFILGIFIPKYRKEYTETIFEDTVFGELLNDIYDKKVNDLEDSVFKTLYIFFLIILICVTCLIILAISILLSYLLVLFFIIVVIIYRNRK